MKRFTILTVLIASCLFARAQYYFLQPIENEQVILAKEVYAVTIAGDTTFGKITSGVLTGGQMKSFTIKQDDKTKVKFSADDVRLLAVKPTNFMNHVSALSVPNIQRASEMDMDALMNREWIYFEQALLPKEKDKYVLMQLLNPGFDHRIKVYMNPSSGTTMTTNVGGLQIAGGEDTSYLVVYDGGKSEVYKKSRYDKEALTELFKDCQAFLDAYQGRDMKWRDFSEHVLVFDQLCTE